MPRLRKGKVTQRMLIEIWSNHVNSRPQNSNISAGKGVGNATITVIHTTPTYGSPQQRTEMYERKRGKRNWDLLT